jgi:release factor glutamine methyltransferase
VIGEALSASAEALAAAGVEDPRLDAELMLAEATGWERARLVASPGAELPPPASRLFAEMVRRRLRREPVAYILGRRGFRHLDLAVDPRVLIPRPETELLVELALELRPRRVLDAGTGSGAIALAVAAELPGCEVIATDTSAAALAVAAANAERLGLRERVELIEGSWPQDGGIDLVLANLPYVSETEWRDLEPEVRNWEPREALLAGPDGLDVIRAFLAGVGPFLGGRAGETTTSERAAVALEVGAGQAPAVAELLVEAGFGSFEIRPDLAGIDRVVVGWTGGRS